MSKNRQEMDCSSYWNINLHGPDSDQIDLIKAIEDFIKDKNITLGQCTVSNYYRPKEKK